MGTTRVDSPIPTERAGSLALECQIEKLGIRNSDLCYDKFNITFRLVIYWNSTFDLATYTLPLQPLRDWRIILCYGGFWARGLEYEVIDDLCYTLIVTRTLGHILCQISIGHRGIRAPELLILSSAL